MKLKNYLKSAICLAVAVALAGCAGTRYDRSTGQYIDDKATSARVKTALAKDSLVKASEVNVQSFRGNVHLTGFVDHPAQKERAGQLTRNTKGVDWFKNDIVVKETLPGEAQMLNGQSMNEPSGANRDYNYTQRQSFQRQSSSESTTGSGGWQKGALNVYDPAAEISVRPSSSVRGNNASASASTSGKGAAFSAETAGSNNNLTQQIYSQLRSDNSGAAENIRVETSSNGKVTLKGMVSSQEEKRAIENRVKAIQGVNKVDNELKVQNDSQ